MADKVKRAERLAVMGMILTSSPNRIFTLSYFCEMFGAAKSTVSEDTAILARTWRTFRLGTVETVTGAAGGIGKEFIRQLKNEKGIDEIWAIGRTEKKLQALREEFGDKVVPVPLDITNDDELIAFQNTLKEKQPNIKWLINCAGTRALYKTDVPLPRMELTLSD